MPKLTEWLTDAPKLMLGLVFLLVFWGGLFSWYWTAYALGSWGMFFMTIFPPTLVVAVVTGAWAIVFGVPEWVLATFG